MQDQETKSNTTSARFLPLFLRRIGLALVGGVIFTLIWMFYPILWEELKYISSLPFEDPQVVALEEVKSRDSNKKSNKETVPVSMEFGIVVPKIGANAPVVANVDPFDSKAYQKELAKGVAHAKGTVFPGQLGNVFLFAHSSENFFEATKYNSVFYLLYKLNKNDELYLTYKNNIYKYTVAEVKIIDGDNIEYLKSELPKELSEYQKTIVLMTCWPAGTTYKRLVVVGYLR